MGGGGGVGSGRVGGGLVGGQGGCERRIEVFFENSKKYRGSSWGSGRGVRVDVNAMLGVGGDVGYGDVNQE